MRPGPGTLRGAATTVAVLLAIATFAGPPGAPCLASTLIPAPPQSEPVAITGAMVHPVSGPAIANATVLFDHGLIVAVGANVVPPVGTRIVDGAGKHVYPGLFAAYSNIGLREIDQARATDDLAEIGDINPAARVEVAYNPDSEHIPVTRSNGVLTALSAPTGGLIGGRAALVRMDGWTWEDVVVKAPAALQITWPAVAGPSPELKPDKREELERPHRHQLERLRKAFLDARAYLRARDAAGTAGRPAHDVDQRWEAMIPVLRGDVPVLVIANGTREIEEAVSWAVEERLRMILAGGAESYRVLDLLKKHDIPVILIDVLREPGARDTPYDTPFTLPATLEAAGIRFAIGMGGGWSLRNLPYHAAMAAAYGLGPEEALRSITLYPARIYGVGDRLGTLEPGKDATLILTDGDILEIPTQVEAAWIDGRPLDLGNRQEELHRKYREKYRQLGILK